MVWGTFQVFMKNYIVLLLCLVGTIGQAQQLDQIGKKKGVKVSGGVGFNNNFYASDGIANRMNPYSYVLSGNVNINVYGFSLPFTFSFSNQNYSYTQPFNIVGLSPTYKKWTFHAGYRNLSFSPYTLSGHNFLGGGVEYRGSALNIAAMGGRLLKAVEYDSTNANALPAYQRYGAGVKIGYKKDGDEIALVGFYAKDDQNSIKTPPKSIGLNAQENMVWSLSFKKQLYKKLVLQMEGARSAWTSDLSAESVKKNEGISSSVYFIPWKSSTVVYNAVKANLSYDFTFMTLGAGYERIDPQYRTLGAYYFNNDLENVTLNAGTSLLKKKITLSANGGVQRDDLDNKKASKMKRIVGSVNLGWNITKRLNLNLSYSNFNSYTNVKPVDVRFLQNTPYDRIDTLNYIQISQTLNGSVSYKISESDYVGRTISMNSSMQKAASKQGGNAQGNEMVNAGLVFNQVWKRSGLNLGVNTNANQIQYDQGNSTFIGLGVTGALPVFNKKLRISLGLNGNQNYEKGVLTARLYSVTNSYSLRVARKHALSASLRYSGRAKIGEATLGRYNTAFNEFIGMLGYNFSF